MCHWKNKKNSLTKKTPICTCHSINKENSLTEKTPICTCHSINQGNSLTEKTPICTCHSINKGNSLTEKTPICTCHSINQGNSLTEKTPICTCHSINKGNSLTEKTIICKCHSIKGIFFVWGGTHYMYIMFTCGLISFGKVWAPLCTLFSLLWLKKYQFFSKDVVWVNGFSCLHDVMAHLWLHCTFICVAFKSCFKWSKAQCVRAPTTTILPTTASLEND